jgi:hypothetical protein
MLKLANGGEKCDECCACGKSSQMGILISRHIMNGQPALSTERELVMAAGAEEICRRLT